MLRLMLGRKVVVGWFDVEAVAEAAVGKKGGCWLAGWV